jgi:hypothetical protein
VTIALSSSQASHNITTTAIILYFAFSLLRFPRKRKRPIAKVTVVAARSPATAPATTSVIILVEVLYPAERVLVPGAARNLYFWDG